LGELDDNIVVKLVSLWDTIVVIWVDFREAVLWATDK
jgi:hypothetical protein